MTQILDPIKTRRRCSVRIRPDSYASLVVLAALDGRKLTDELSWIIQDYERRATVRRLESLECTPS